MVAKPDQRLAACTICKIVTDITGIVPIAPNSEFGLVLHGIPLTRDFPLTIALACARE